MLYILVKLGAVIELRRKLPGVARVRIDWPLSESILALPAITTADDVLILKSSSPRAETWFTGASNWKRYIGGQQS